VFAWPTAQKPQEEHDEALVAAWLAAKAVVEKRDGAFDHVLVFGFSNGAYYASSLALRGRLPVDGYAAFAGGAGGKYARHLGQRAERKVPLFVGYGTKDPDHGRQQTLIRSLREMKWPHASKADGVGHTVSDAQVRAALAFLLGTTSDAPAPESAPSNRGSTSGAAQATRKTPEK
jgi:predicted esterase